MNNKKLFQIIVIFVVAVWVFCITLSIGVLRVRKQNESLTAPPPLSTSNSYTQDQTTQSTEPSVSQENPTVTPSEPTTEPTTAPTEQPTEQNSDSQSQIPSSKSDIIRTYVEAVNRLKNEQNFSLTKSELLSVSISQMSPDSVRTMANKIIESNRKTRPDVYNFVNGFDSASGMSPNNVIAPLGTYAALSESIVTKAAAIPNSDGSYFIKLSLGEEYQTLNSAAPNYSTSMQVIKVEELGIPTSAKLDSMTVTYNNSTIEALIGKDGRITAMKHYLNVSNAEGTGSMVVPVSVKMRGDFTCNYQIKY